MKIGLFFGSFNPIHIGHLIIANNISDFYTDEVWFIVSPQNPFKNNDELLTAERRYTLTKKAIENNFKFKVSNIEFKLSIPSYTINTLQKISKEYTKDEFFLIMGSDNLQGLNSWKSADEIINTYKILVYERQNFPVDKKNLHQNITVVKSPLLGISSTYIRKLIAENKSIQYLVPDNVRRLIEENGYFK